jgi:succinate-semialdehyde dehydrogenase/glutarate-semialdehyde dehydrogenase
MAMESINPATGEVLKKYEPHSRAQVEEKLQRASALFPTWRKTSFAHRAERMLKVAGLLESEKGRWARLMAEEMGKPLAGGEGEAVKCAKACRYYAENAERFLADERIDTGEDEAFVRHQPLGVVLAVMPWNFPFWQVLRFAAPALMAGNVGLLKHASNVPGCALALEELFVRAGFPEGAFQTLLIGSSEVKAVLGDPRVAAVTLTGSNAAGSQVASQAGHEIKKSVLELGGSDPFIVMPSADLDKAVETAVQARVINNGQSCIAAKRFIVAEPIAAEFERRFVERMKKLVVGDPLDPKTEVGPLATPSIRDEVDDQVQRSVKAGARLLCGGKKRPGPGNYYEPTALGDVPRDAAAAREEVFGPVAALFRAKDLTEAIRIANDSPYGLGCSAWTNDPEERARLIDEVESGGVFINQMVASDPRLPFGGVKQSGFGRELGPHGIREFVNVKTVRVSHGQAPAKPSVPAD